MVLPATKQGTLSGSPVSASTNLGEALLSIFKKRLVDNREKETALERCEFELQAKPDQTKCRLIVRLFCQYGVVKTNRLTYEAIDVLHATFDKARSPNYWAVSSRTLRDVVEYFGPKTEQLDWFFEKGKVTFTSYTEKVQRGREILKQPIHTSVALERKDFNEFNVEEGLHIGIVVKDFRAIISHAETMRANVTARYSRGNRPLQMAYESDGVRAEFTLMTRGHSNAVPTGSTASTPARDLSVQPVGRPAETRGEPSRPAPTQPVRQIPPPTGATTSTRTNREPMEVGDQPRRNSPQPPPPPSARINPESLFLPAGDDDRQWDEPNYDNEQDFVTWDTPSNFASMADSGSRIRDLQPTSFQSGRLGAGQGETREFPPTQRLSQVRGLFGD